MHTEKQTNKHHILSHTRIHSKWNASVYVYMHRISYINCPITGRVMFMLSSRALYGQPLHRRPLKCVPGGRRLLLRVGKAFLFTCTYFMQISGNPCLLWRSRSRERKLPDLDLWLLLWFNTRARILTKLI